MSRKIQKNANVDKLALMTIVLNTLQIVASLCLMAVVLVYPGSLDAVIMRVGLSILCLIVSWGALIDIRDAYAARNIWRKNDMLETSQEHLEDLNNEMRKQRHDFMNHLQVVYSLVELGDEQETLRYIENVYGALKQVGKALKTSVPAVNAMISAKQNDAQTRNIQMEIEVYSSLEGISMPGWELCSVLGNLIDNAFDAMKESTGARVGVTLSQDEHNFILKVENNGPEIPSEIRERIFEARFSTKGADRGMGLSIVSDIVHRAGGDILLTSDEKRTCFVVTLPRGNRAE